MPFHGVAPRGLLATLGPSGQAVWERAAPAIEEWLAHGGDGTGIPPHLLAAARAAGVVSLAASAEVAAAYAEVALAAPPAELWSVKEGHTSTVWRVTSADGAAYAVNVARDLVATEELATSAGVLATMAAALPDVVAAPVATGRVPAGGAGEVAVLVQPWVAGALEVGAPRRGDGSCALLAVERFLTDPGSPARIVAVRGRRLDDGEQRTVAALWAAATLAGTRPAGDGLVAVPRIEVREGDLVLAPWGPAVVAASAEHDVTTRTALVPLLLDRWQRLHLDRDAYDVTADVIAATARSAA